MHPSQKARLFRELGQLVRTGTAFPKAVEKLARLSGGQARASLTRIKAALDAGRTVGESLGEGAPLISTLEACVFTASDRAGKLDAGLEQASQYHAALAAARSLVVSRLAYPVFMIHFAMLVLPLTLLFGENGGLPQYLRAVAFRIGGLWLAVFIVAAILRALLVAAGRSAAPDRLLRAIPVFGKLRRDFALGRFCSAYHMQLDAGVNILSSLESSAAAAGSAILGEAVAGVLPDVRAGWQVGPALEKTRAFPERFLRAFSVGEETGELDRELQLLGDEYRDSAMRRLGTISEWVPRLIFIGIAVWIGWKVISFYLDYFRMLDSIR